MPKKQIDNTPHPARSHRKRLTCPTCAAEVRIRFMQTHLKKAHDQQP